MTVSIRLGLAVALAATLIASACARRASDDKPPEAGDRAVATVGDRTIWGSDVKREAIAQGLIGEGEPLDVSSDLFRRVLNEVIDQKLLAAEARKRKLDQDPLARRRLDAAEERILGDLLVEKQVEKAVTDNAINALYQEQLRLSRLTEEFKAHQIVTRTLAEAEAIRKLVQAGGSFEQLAMERSTDAETRFKGGEIPDYFTLDVMPEAYATALKDARTGQVVGPFAGEQGFVLLKVIDRRPEQPLSLDAAKPQIVRFLTYDEVRELLETLRRGARVRMLLPGAPDVPGAPREPDSAPPPAPGALPAPAPTGKAPPPKGPAPKAAAPAAKGPAPKAAPAAPAKAGQPPAGHL